jgi:hypothetical protein
MCRFSDAGMTKLSPRTDGHARKLIQAKDINEVMRLQSEFLRTQFAAATEPLKKLGGESAAKDASNEKPELI